MARDQDDVAAGTRFVLVVMLIVGLGLVAAPFAFRMFERAPEGGAMLDEFEPFVRRAKLAEFRGFLAEIDAAIEESGSTVEPAAAARLGLTPAQYAARARYLGALRDEWPGIQADMTDMLDRVDRNVANYRGVAALPPLPLFPWFFVIPGALVAGGAAFALVRRRRGRSTSGALLFVGVMGVGLIAAPAVFQMFSRAPGGAVMIDDFRSMMTRDRVTTIQGYFLTLGNGESDLRSKALPDAALTIDTPASDALVRDWPRINREMSPFVGVMADNLDNFAAVAALPPFELFPWFFVVPGVLLAALGFTTYLRQRRRQRQPDPGGNVNQARRATVATAVVLALVVAAMSVGVAGAVPAAKKSTKLVGTFSVEPTTAASGAPTSGSYFRMVMPNGTLAAGPFIENGDSTLSDKTYTAVQPGTDGGLVTGTYQPAPDPAFDAAGNGVADLILAPQAFFGVNFAVATNKTDPQDGAATRVPTITVSAKGALTGNLSAYGVAYGKQNFNQGAPKPAGSNPGLTKAPTGTYDAKTGKYTLEWSSAVVGGPFDGFTGIWHFEGTFSKKK